jgi:hypothetical protein
VYFQFIRAKFTVPEFCEEYLLDSIIFKEGIRKTLAKGFSSNGPYQELKVIGFICKI